MTEIPYINRGLSWLSSNLDEFFRVRVASIQQLLKLKKKKQEKLQEDPQDILVLLLKEVRRQQEWFGRIFRKEAMLF